MGNPWDATAPNTKSRTTSEALDPGKNPENAWVFLPSFNFCLGFGEGKNPIAIVKNTSKEAENKFR